MKKVCKLLITALLVNTHVEFFVLATKVVSKP